MPSFQLLSCALVIGILSQSSQVNANAAENTSRSEILTQFSSTESTVTTEVEINSTVHQNETGTDSVQSTTTVPAEPTSTPPSTTVVPITADTSSPFFCPCDYVLNSCEINCCCDPDCSARSKMTFSTCVDVEAFRKIFAARDARRCVKEDFILRNNTVYKTEISQNGQFCVVRNNLKQDQEFPAVKVNLDKITKVSKSKYFWQFDMGTQKEFPQRSSKFSYKYGNQIQLALRTTKNDAEPYERQGMVLPFPAFGLTCNAKSHVTFLQNQTSSCHIHVYNLSHQCQTDEILNVMTLLPDSFVVSNPSLNLVSNNLINMTYVPCLSNNEVSSDNSGCNRTVALKSPRYDPVALICFNVLTQLDLVFKHRGTDGIVKVTAHTYYTNYSLETTSTIMQKFATRYEWDNPEDDNIPPRLTSGNPGYIIGRPVLIGLSTRVKGQDLVKNKVVTESNVKEATVIHPHHVETLTVFNPKYCDGTTKGRKPLLFGYDLSVTCLLEYVNLGSCQNLSSTIGTILFGMSPNKFMSRYVATLGNPHLMVNSHWIPWVSFGDPFKVTDLSVRPILSGCHGIITAMHIHFLYAHVGSIHFPQLKIFGAFIHFGGSTTIPGQAENVTTDASIYVTTTVKFTDVTSPPFTPIPKWPSISIRLPQDFFYPFSIASSAGRKFEFCGITFPVLVAYSFFLEV